VVSLAVPANLHVYGVRSNVTSGEQRGSRPLALLSVKVGPLRASEKFADIRICVGTPSQSSN